MRHKTLFSDTRLTFAAGDGPGSFEGYAVHYDTPVLSGDIIKAGAFDASLPDFLHKGSFLVQHDWEAIAVGMFTGAHSDDKGLWVEGQFHSTPTAQEARTVAAERLAAGKQVALSVGFFLEESQPIDKNDRWGPALMTRGKLVEVSMVGVGNDPNASLMRTNSLHDGEQFAEQSERVLAAVEDWLERVRGLRSVREYEGRVLSQKNLGRLMAHADALEQCAADMRGMIADATPQENAASMAPLMMEIEGVLARLGGAA